MTKNSGVSKFFWGTQKISGDQQNVFGADLRKNGEPKVNLGSGKNIFGHLIFFWGLKKIFSGVENVSAHKINISAHKINISAHKINISAHKINISAHKINVSAHKIYFR